MTVKLSINQLIEDIYADSALGAVLGRRDSSGDVALLTADHRRALRRVLAHAAAVVASQLGNCLLKAYVTDSQVDADLGEITFVLADSCDASPEALHFHFASAVSFAALKLVAVAEGDRNRAATYSTCTSETLAAITSCLDRLPTRIPPRPLHY